MEIFVLGGILFAWAWFMRNVVGLRPWGEAPLSWGRFEHWRRTMVWGLLGVFLVCCVLGVVAFSIGMNAWVENDYAEDVFEEKKIQWRIRWLELEHGHEAPDDDPVYRYNPDGPTRRDVARRSQ